ncbi:MAG: hypothetical protein LBK04_04075 [Clostridiales Family XIII bacterium]|nr:hypothetical protein [Clostridiales Family XIII bacterium]
MQTINRILSSLASISVYAIFLAGVLTLVSGYLRQLGDVIGARKRLRTAASPARNGYSSLIRHLGYLLSVVSAKRLSPALFLTLTAGLFLVVFITTAFRMNTFSSLCFAGTAAFMPYFYMRIRLERIRRKASHEGEMMMSAFLTSYLVTGGNVYEAIERTHRACSHLPVTTALISRLLSGMRATGNPAWIRKATREFSYGIGTSWSRTFAFIIDESAISGRNMTAAIEDIISQLKEARALAEERKRLNGESARMLTWLTPCIYALSIAAALFFLGIPLTNIIRNQFFEPTGFSLFTIGVFIFLINRMLLELTMNRKLDF